MQLSDFPRFCQRGLQATYFTWPARVTFRHLLLPQHHWLSGAGAQDYSSYKRLRRPTVSSRQPPFYASVSQPGNRKHECCCYFFYCVPASRRRLWLLYPVKRSSIILRPSAKRIPLRGATAHGQTRPALSTLTMPRSPAHLAEPVQWFIKDMMQLCKDPPAGTFNGEGEGKEKNAT